VAVAWPYAYVADGGGGLRVLDVSHPDDPYEIGFYSAPGNAQDVAVMGNYAYVSHSDAGLRVVDISNPANPVEVGAYNPTAYAGAVAVAEGELPGQLYAYVKGEVNLEVVDVSNPAAPAGVGSYAPPLRSPGRVVAASGPPGQAYAYVLDEGDLKIVDISEPAAPVRIGVYDPPESAVDVAVAQSDPPGQTFAYVAAGGAGLRVVNVSDPASPVEVGFLNTLAATKVTVAAGAPPDYAYILEGNVGLRIVDTSDPTDPVVVGSYDTPGQAKHVAVAASDPPGQIYAYVVDSDQSVWTSYLRVVDVSDPSNPVQTGFCELPSYEVGDLAVAGTHAYLAVGDVLYRYLSIVDVSDPSAPAVVGAHYGGPAETVAVAGQCVYYAGYHSLSPSVSYWGLYVVDITDPVVPAQIGYYKLLGWMDVAVEAGNIYVAGDGAGLSILRFTDLALDGRVSQANGLPAPGVEMALNPGPTTTTDADGAYSFADLYSGEYTLSPSLPGYTFQPVARTLILPPRASGVNFILLPLPVSTTLTPGVATSLTYTDTQGLPTTLDFPPDAVTQTTTVFLTPTVVSRQAGYAFAGHAFELAAYRTGTLQPGLVFSAPVSVALHYSDWDVRVVTDELELELWWRMDGGWQDAAQTCDPATDYDRDAAGNVLGVPICRVGGFALFGPTREVYLPVMYQLWP
jgi:hypothetical protein